MATTSTEILVGRPRRVGRTWHRVVHIPANANWMQRYSHCGNRRCGLCRLRDPETGKHVNAGHGPYWYAYWREAGEKIVVYVGKTRPDNVEGGEQCSNNTSH